MKHRSSPPPTAAFTLVELLVATVVLALLIATVAQLTNNATTVITNSRKHMDADSQARLVFDRIANDLSRMLKRKDVDYYFDKSAGNDRFFFYSEAPAYFSNGSNKSPVSLIGYRINSSLQLERLGKGLAWDGAATGSSPGSVLFLTYPAASPPPAAGPTPYPASTISGNWPDVVSDSSTDPDFHVIGEQVYRMEFCYLLKSGVLSNTPYIAPNTTINGFQDVSAIVVALAILDSSSQAPITDTSKMVGALSDLSDAELVATPAKTLAQTWLNAVDSESFAKTSGIHQAAAAQVRIYQRYFYLNNH